MDDFVEATGQVLRVTPGAGFAVSEHLGVVVTVCGTDCLKLWRLPGCLSHRWHLLRSMTGVGQRPCDLKGVGFMEDGASCPLAVCDQGSDTVHMVNALTGAVLADQGLRIEKPLHVACNADSHMVAVSTAAKYIAVFKAGLCVFKMGYFSVAPGGLVFAPAGLWVANTTYSGGVLLFDPTTGRLKHSLHVGRHRRHVDLHPLDAHGGRWALSSMLSQDVVVTDFEEDTTSGEAEAEARVVASNLRGIPMLGAARHGEQLFIREQSQVRVFYRGSLRSKRQVGPFRALWALCLGTHGTDSRLGRP